MSLYNLDKVMNPASVAVIGATDRPGTIGRAVVDNLIKGGFEGRIHPINPQKSEILGLAAHPTMTDVGQAIDMAVVCTPIHTVPGIIEEAGELGVGGAVVISAGGKEVGDDGAAIEADILARARAGRVRVVGPNCIGIVASRAKLNASFAHIMPQPGRLAFVSQSGAVCTSALDFAVQEKIGFSHFISIGSMLDVDFGDLIDYLGRDEDVSAILLYVEMVNNHRTFLSAARDISRIKPIIVLKSGRSAAGAAAAQSHTGSLAGEDAVYDAAFKRAGIIRVDHISDLFGCAELLGKIPRPKGPSMAIVTNTGGPGVMAADFLAQYGLTPGEIAPNTFRRIDSMLPPIWSRGNPMDLTGAAKIDDLAKVAEICANAPEFDAVLVVTAPQAMFSSTEMARHVAERLAGQDCPVFAVFMGGTQMEEPRKLLNAAGVPTYATPEEAIRAFTYLYNYDRNLKLLQEVPSELKHPLKYDRPVARTIIDAVLGRDGRLMTEVESKALLDAYGIPSNRTVVARTVEEAVFAARRIGYPVAAKVHSHTLTHKSDAGGVKLDLRNADEVIDAFEAIKESVAAYDPEADFSGVTIQQMVGNKGYEVIIGSKRDPDWGPIVLFGLGGVMTELFQDRSIGLPPLNRLLARRMIESTKVSKMLKGFRNLPPANMQLLEEVLIRLGQLVTDFPEIVELDVNPLLLTGGWAYAVDARVVLAPADKPAPLHLAISPYPAHYAGWVKTKAGKKVYVRPVKPEDAPLLREMINTLSPESIRNRFPDEVPDLEGDDIVRFTQVDYDRELALVVLDDSSGRTRMMGVTRLMEHPDGEDAHWTVIVGDPWQGQGIGALLMESAWKAATERGLKRLWGVTSRDNPGMLALAERYSAQVEPIDDGLNYRITYQLPEK